MGLGTITIGSDTFLDSGNGRYISSTQTFAGPRNELKISPGVLQRKATPPTTNCSVTRLLELDSVVDGKTVRDRAQVTLSVALSSGLTAATADALALQISDFTTEVVLNQILAGNS